MQTNPDFEGMARDLAENGMDSEQGARHESAFRAAKVAAVAIICARYGASESEMLNALRHSRNLNADMHPLVERMELSPAFIAHIHSGFTF